MIQSSTRVWKKVIVATSVLVAVNWNSSAGTLASEVKSSHLLRTKDDGVKHSREAGGRNVSSSNNQYYIYERPRRSSYHFDQFQRHFPSSLGRVSDDIRHQQQQQHQVAQNHLVDSSGQNNQQPFIPPLPTPSPVDSFHNQQRQGQQFINVHEPQQSASLHRSQFEAISGFNCEGKMPGYYADLRASCQIYHVCKPDGKQESYQCPNGTIFGGSVLICNWWYKTACGYDGSPPMVLDEPTHQQPIPPNHFPGQPNREFVDHFNVLRPDARPIQPFVTGPGGPNNNVVEGHFHQPERVIQIPEFVAIAPPFDLSPRKHSSLSQDGGGSGSNPDQGTAPLESPLQPQLSVTAQRFQTHPQEAFQIQNQNQPEPLVSLSQIQGQPQQSHEPEFPVRPTDSSRFQSYHQQTFNPYSHLQQQSNFNLGSSSNYRPTGNNGQGYQQHNPNENPRKFVTAEITNPGPVVLPASNNFDNGLQQGQTVGNPGQDQVLASGSDSRKFILKLKRTQDDVNGQNRDQVHQWMGFEHPPPYNPGQNEPSRSETNNPSSPQKITSNEGDITSSGPSGKLPFTELQISGKIRIPVSPDRLFRAVPLFREFHYKETEIPQEAAGNGSRKRDHQQEAQASNEVNVIDKNAAFVQGLQNGKDQGQVVGNKFNLMGPDVSPAFPATPDVPQRQQTGTAVGNSGPMSSHPTSTRNGPFRPNVANFDRHHQQIRRVNPPQALVDTSQMQASSNASQPSPMQQTLSSSTTSPSSVSLNDPVSTTPVPPKGTVLKATGEADSGGTS